MGLLPKNRGPWIADNARRVADLEPKTKNRGPKFMRLSKFVRFQELRVAGRGPWNGVADLGSRTGYHGSRTLGVAVRFAGKGRGYKAQV